MEVQIHIFWHIFKKMEVQVFDFRNILKNMKAQILDFYTNPRLGPNYGFWNGIFSLTNSFLNYENFKEDAEL